MRWIFLFPFLLSIATAIAAEVAQDTLDKLTQAQSEYRRGDIPKALQLVNEHLEANASAQGYIFRAALLESKGELSRVVADYDKALEMEPNAFPGWYHKRGAAHFRLGNIEKALADFDKFLEMYPSQKPFHWQRGIALYYAGKFAEGAAQFELHQTVNSEDVENAVWHFLCVARQSGLEEARKKLITIHHDGRVPMMQIFELFQGKSTPAKVLETAGAEKEGPARTEALFYAHLYLGLYYEALKDSAKALEHIRKAGRDLYQPHYMGDVAKVQLGILEKKAQ